MLKLRFLSSHFLEIEISKRLATVAAFNPTNKTLGSKMGLLQYAVRNGNDWLVAILLRIRFNFLGFSPRFQEDIDPLLVLAATRGHMPIVQRLVRAGADVNKKARNGMTPLRAAVIWGHVRMVEFLVETGARAQRDRRWQPIHDAVLHHRERMTKFLLETGADVNSRTRRMETPLHIAARGNSHILDILVAAGADVNTKTRNGHTPLQIAFLHGGQFTVQSLLEAGATADAQTLAWRHTNGWEQWSGSTHLHLAASMGHTRAMDSLLKAGADFTFRDEKGRTPRDVAEICCHQETEKMLKDWQKNVALAACMSLRRYDVPHDIQTTILKLVLG